jgi:hypothetical protein
MPNEPTDQDYLSLTALVMSIARAKPGQADPLPPGQWTKLDVPVQDNRDIGFFARAFVNPQGQVVIAFAGPTSSPGSGKSSGSGASTTDEQIMSGRIPQDYRDAVSHYTDAVLAAAAKNGLPKSAENIFTTGNSLGGYAAQYSASLHGFGGASFGGPGVFDLGPYKKPDKIDRFQSYIIAGDPVANASTDSGIHWGKAQQFGPHYGQTVFLVGSENAQAELQNAATQYATQLAIATTTGMGTPETSGWGTMIWDLGKIFSLVPGHHDFSVYEKMIADPAKAVHRQNVPPVTDIRGPGASIPGPAAPLSIPEQSPHPIGDLSVVAYSHLAGGGNVMPPSSPNMFVNITDPEVNGVAPLATTTPATGPMPTTGDVATVSRLAETFASAAGADDAVRRNTDLGSTPNPLTRLST